jgi:hypothetical protein
VYQHYRGSGSVTAVRNPAALRMPREAKLCSDAVPLVGLISCTVLALSLALPVVMTRIAVLAVGLVLRTLLRKRR